MNYLQRKLDTIIMFDDIKQLTGKDFLETGIQKGELDILDGSPILFTNFQCVVL